MLEEKAIKILCQNDIKHAWITSKETFPDFFKAVPSQTKHENEIAIQTFIDTLNNQLNAFPKLPLKRNRWKQKTLRIINEFLCQETIMGIHTHIDSFTLESFDAELKEFLRQVRLFAPELEFDGIGQAIRNYILFIMMKEMNGVHEDFNQACFGYSMLYPFTDNFIDSTEYSDQAKKIFNQMIRDKINGTYSNTKLQINSQSIHHKKTCDLLQMIEDRYPREQDGTIYTLLISMLNAQVESLTQQNKNIYLNEQQRLDISTFKGGMSVLIDRFFVNKAITQDDLIYYLGFGFFLQLADDLQDIYEDSQSGNQTLFTVQLDYEAEEKLVNKLLHFIHNISNCYESENQEFKELVLSSCYQLILSSVIGSKQFFSEEYLTKIEAFLPTSLTFFDNLKNTQLTESSLKKNEKKLTDNRDKYEKKYLKMLDSLIL